MSYTIQQLAELGNVSERTLRHYDEIGLLSPGRNKDNNYREYTDTDISRLYTILVLKEMGIPLAEIKERIDSPYFSLTSVLEDAKDDLSARKKQLEHLINKLESYSDEDAIEQNKKAHEAAGMEEAQAHAYALEAHIRWGSSETYKQSIKKTKNYIPKDWARVKEEGKQIALEAAALMKHEPEHELVQRLMQRYFDYMQQFYDCSKELFAELGKMYVEDPRFKKYYEDIRDGLASFMKEAMHIFARQK